MCVFVHVYFYVCICMVLWLVFPFEAKTRAKVTLVAFEPPTLNRRTIQKHSHVLGGLPHSELMPEMGVVLDRLKSMTIIHGSFLNL